MSQKSVAIIPARGGSKRIPRKNVRPFAGRPMLAHSVGACLASGAFDRVIVSTDDPEIAAVAREHGAEVPYVRPAELADDFADTNDVMRHAVRQLRIEGEGPALACCVYATAPFIRVADLLEGRRLMQADRDYAFSATTFPFPIYRAFTYAPQEGLRMVMPEHYDTRSQDLPTAWHDAAQFYWGTPDAWLERRMIFGPRSAIVPLPHWRVQDIDTPQDWERAELLYRMLQELPDGAH